MAVPAPTDKRFRRAHVSPTRRGRRWVISRKGVAYTGLLVAGVAYLAYRSTALVMASHMLTVTRIDVAGNARLSRGEVLSLLDGLQGRNMLLVDLDEWRGKLLASPWVADAAFRRLLPGGIEVVISEREPIAIMRAGDSLHLIDETGDIMDEYGPHHAELDLPIINGLSASKDGRSVNPAADEARAALAARLLTSLRERPDLAARVSEVNVSDARNAVVMLKGDVTMIRLGDGEFVERLQAYLDIAPALRERASPLDHVDMRFGGKVPVKPIVGRVREP